VGCGTKLMIQKFTELLSNLLLGLLAILVPIFAVMISVSARAIQDGRRKLEQNIKGIFADVDEIRKKSAKSAETTLKELKKAIQKYSWKRRKAQTQLFLLTTRAAIYYPGLLFLGSLGLLLRPLSHFAQLTRMDSWLVYSSCGLTVIGAALLCGVLETVSRFASTYEVPPAGDAPNFSLTFAMNNTGVLVASPSSKQQIALSLSNTSDYMGDTIDVCVFFPPQFQKPELKNAANLRLSLQTTFSALPGYWGVFWNLDRLHAQIMVSSPSFEVQVPGEKGEYVVRAHVRAAKIRVIQTELKVIVN
jgi:hypothetical protein